MNVVTIGKNCVINKSIIADNVEVGDDVIMGDGEEVPNKLRPDIYAFGLVTIGEGSTIPSGVKIGKNTAISGNTSLEDYKEKCLESGETIIKAGDR